MATDCMGLKRFSIDHRFCLLIIARCIYVLHFMEQSGRTTRFPRSVNLLIVSATRAVQWQKSLTHSLLAILAGDDSGAFRTCPNPSPFLPEDDTSELRRLQRRTHQMKERAPRLLWMRCATKRQNKPEWEMGAAQSRSGCKVCIKSPWTVV